MDVAVEAEDVNRAEVFKAIPAAKAKWASAGVIVNKPTADEQKLWYDKYALVWDSYKTKNKAAKDIDSIFNDWKKAVETPR
jgi:hypothetical protein